MIKERDRFSQNTLEELDRGVAPTDIKTYYEVIILIKTPWY